MCCTIGTLHTHTHSRTHTHIPVHVLTLTGVCTQVKWLVKVLYQVTTQPAIYSVLDAVELILHGGRVGAVQVWTMESCN